MASERSVGTGAVGLGAPEPADYATHTHIIVTRIEWDGEVIVTRSDPQRGEAAASHERLAKRWKVAGTKFVRDKAARSLTKHHADYVDRIETVTHEPTPTEEHDND